MQTSWWCHFDKIQHLYILKQYFCHTTVSQFQSFERIFTRTEHSQFLVWNVFHTSLDVFKFWIQYHVCRAVGTKGFVLFFFEISWLKKHHAWIDSRVEFFKLRNLKRFWNGSFFSRDNHKSNCSIHMVLNSRIWSYTRSMKNFPNEKLWILDTCVKILLELWKCGMMWKCCFNG